VEVLEDEKILGTVHVALGDNHTIGGIVEVPSHLDGVILSPTLEIDGKIIMAEGRLLDTFSPTIIKFCLPKDLAQASFLLRRPFWAARRIFSFSCRG
jgi:hypothetical protein